MPKLPIDYSKTIIYKIICCDPNIKDCYVGHTTDFTRRKAGHKHHCNNPNSKCNDLKVYKTIRENGDWDNWQMVMIEEFSCKNKLEATKRERECFEALQANLNTNKPYVTQQEIKVRNREKCKEYRDKNPEKIREILREYYEENKEDLKEKRKEYRLNNKNKIKNDFKNWYEVNKEEYLQKKKEKVICPICKSSSTKRCLNRHQQSQKCKQFTINQTSS